MKSCIRLLSAASIAGLLCSCAAVEEPPAEPTFYRSMAQAGVEVDAAAAASMISGYRRNNGLGVVTLDPALMRAAALQSEAMARNNKFEHNAGGEFRDRIQNSGIDASVAVENIGAGYHTLAEAFSGWRDSPPHRANMLRAGVTRMGISAVYTPNSKYKVFWTLILAGVDDGGGKGALRAAGGKRGPVMGAPEPRVRRPASSEEQ